MSLFIKPIVIANVHLPQYIKNTFEIISLRLTQKFLSETGVFMDSSIN